MWSSVFGISGNIHLNIVPEICFSHWSPFSVLQAILFIMHPLFSASYDGFLYPCFFTKYDTLVNSKHLYNWCRWESCKTV